ncbi:hypothetical protein BDV39DRAFT_193798 [Aspergillus sergii]|uniref:Chitinase n=1 Tax=Aspergillus sergii TaxID=1034303 RepID=A0A5N6X2E4_9EURO|nr:hypothetical protein BDV39DRAFT_193798 [Aspergillus sergii]
MHCGHPYSLKLKTTTIRLDDLVTYIDSQSRKQSSIAHPIIGCFHRRTNEYLHLNDYPPGHEHCNHICLNRKTLQERGLNLQVLFSEASFKEGYNMFSTMFKRYRFDGIDLDTEETMSQDDTSRLVNRLTADFGIEPEISMAPCCNLVQGVEDGFSGMNYSRLDRYRRAIVDAGFHAFSVLACIMNHYSNGCSYAGFLGAMCWDYFHSVPRGSVRLSGVL